MLSTRRFFASILPAIPFAGAATRSGLGSSITPATPPPLTGVATYSWKEATAKIVREAAPPALKKYQEAREAMYQANRYRSRLMEFQRCRDRVDYNIESLKSVSRQHKVHMQIKKIDDERKQELSLMDALAESLGLTEFLKKGMTVNDYSEGVATSPGQRAY
jgi:hypothetical protein